VLAYEMVTGTVPFDADELKDLLMLHVHAPVPDARTRRPDLPKALAELFIEMMAKQPSERPTAEEVTWRLNAIMRTEADNVVPSKPTVLIASEDLGFCGKLGRKFENWAPHAKVKIGRTVDKAIAVVDNDDPYLVLVDLECSSGVEMLMGLRGSEKQPAATIALTNDVHSTDFTLLRRMNVICIVPKGESMDDELEDITRNVLNPRRASGWLVRDTLSG
jgi:serine/threonine protein kinase